VFFRIIGLAPETGWIRLSTEMFSVTSFAIESPMCVWQFTNPGINNNPSQSIDSSFALAPKLGWRSWIYVALK
jgi:hypothetical protein